MAQDNPPPRPASVPSCPLEALPHPAHATIATMFDSRDFGVSGVYWMQTSKQFRLALLSRTMLELYGGTLTGLSLQWGPTHQVEALASLVQRQRGLEKVYVKAGEGAVPALVSLLTQGRLRHLKELGVWMDFNGPTTMTHVQDLAEQVPGALQALEYLSFHPFGDWPPGVFPLLMGGPGDNTCRRWSWIGVLRCAIGSKRWTQMRRWSRGWCLRLGADTA